MEHIKAYLAKSFKAYKSAYEACANAYKACENVNEARDSALCFFGPFLLKCGIIIASALIIFFLFHLLSPTIVWFFVSEEEKQKIIREINFPTRSVEECDWDAKTVDIGDHANW